MWAGIACNCCSFRVPIYLAQAICTKARKLPKQTAELKDDLDAFEAKLANDAAEVAEEHAAARAARKQVILFVQIACVDLLAHYCS